MNKKVVVMGGGTGISYLLRGLKDFPVDITAVITVSLIVLGFVKKQAIFINSFSLILGYKSFCK